MNEAEFAVDPQGNAIAVWSRSDGTNQRAQAAFRPSGGSFAGAQTISDAGQGASDPHIGFDPQGNAIAIWPRSDGANTRIQAAFRPVGGAFGGAQTISDAGQDAFDPEIALDLQGNAIATWQRFDGADNRVQAAVRPAGGSFASSADDLRSRSELE